MTSKTIKEVVVVVTKDPMMKTPVTVYEHEVLVLQEVHGEDAVEVKEEYEVYVPEGFTAADEYERMLAKYGFRLQRNQPHPVVAIWGKGPQALADHLGIAVGRRTKRVMNESEQTVRDPRRVDATGKDGLVSSNAVGMQTAADDDDDTAVKAKVEKKPADAKPVATKKKAVKAK